MGPAPEPVVAHLLEIAGRGGAARSDRPREGDVGDPVDALADEAGWRREPLEQARDVLLDRLHRDASDLAATRALRLVSRALDRVGHPGTAVSPPARRQASWWRRRRTRPTVE